MYKCAYTIVHIHMQKNLPSMPKKEKGMVTRLDHVLKLNRGL
jgi:hypothetical protein